MYKQILFSIFNCTQHCKVLNFIQKCIIKKKHVISTMYNKNHLWFYTFKKKEKKTPRDEDEKHGLQYMYMSSDPNLPNDFRTFVRAPVYYLF